MDELSLYEHILSLQPPWSVEHVKLEANEVHVYVDYDRDAPLSCPVCGLTCSRYDTRARVWRHLDTCQYQTLVHGDIPRVNCPEHGALQIDVPWAERNARFTALFEAYVIEWLKEASINAVSRQLAISWNAIDGIMRRAVTRGLKARTQVNVRHLAVDEVCSKKGHEYVTIVSNEAGSVIDVMENRSKASLLSFYNRLTSEDLQSIETVSMDMCQAYQAATKEALADWRRKICFDRFHIAMDLNKAVDDVRKIEMRALPSQYREPLRRSRFTWLRSHLKLQQKHREKIAQLEKVATRTARAWAIRQYAMQLWDYKSRYWAEQAWQRWYGWAIRSRLQPIKIAAKSIKKNLWGIINAIVHRKNNARAESINSRIKILKVRARGYRNKDRFRTAILFYLGGLDLHPKTAST
jgi:transposase